MYTVNNEYIHLLIWYDILCIFNAQSRCFCYAHEVVVSKTSGDGIYMGVFILAFFLLVQSFGACIKKIINKINHFKVILTSIHVHVYVGGPRSLLLSSNSYSCRSVALDLKKLQRLPRELNCQKILRTNKIMGKYIDLL